MNIGKIICSNPNIFFIITTALFTLSTLKKIHVIFIKLNVINQAKNLFIPIEVFLNIFNKISAKPCKDPQTIKFHPAPCQNPPIKKVSRKFIFVTVKFILFPPRGI